MPDENLTEPRATPFVTQHQMEIRFTGLERKIGHLEASFDEKLTSFIRDIRVELRGISDRSSPNPMLWLGFLTVGVMVLGIMTQQFVNLTSGPIEKKVDDNFQTVQLLLEWHHREFEMYQKYVDARLSASDSQIDDLERFNEAVALQRLESAHFSYEDYLEAERLHTPEE